MKFPSLCAALILAGAVPAQAALITGVTATTTMGTFITYNIANLTNGSGLTAPISLSSGGDQQYSNMWLSNGIGTGAIVFDLGDSYELEGMSIWNYNVKGLTERGVRTYSLDYSLDGVAYQPLQVSTTLAKGDAVLGTEPPLAPSVIAVPTAITAQYVRMTIAQNWGSSGFTGLSEVQFTDIPEPTVLGGIVAASAGLLLRKRQAKA